MPGYLLTLTSFNKPIFSGWLKGLLKDTKNGAISKVYPPYFPYTPLNYLRETAGLLFQAVSLNRRLPGKQA